MSNKLMILTPITPVTIRVERAKRNMKSKDLAAKLGVSGSYLSRLEHDKETISLEFAKKLAGVFGYGFTNGTIEPGMFFSRMEVRHDG